MLTERLLCVSLPAPWVEEMGFGLWMGRQAEAGRVGALTGQAALLGVKGKEGFPAGGLELLGFGFPLCGPRPVHSPSASTSAPVCGH